MDVSMEDEPYFDSSKVFGVDRPKSSATTSEAGQYEDSLQTLVGTGDYTDNPETILSPSDPNAWYVVAQIVLHLDEQLTNTIKGYSRRIYPLDDYCDELSSSTLPTYIRCAALPLSISRRLCASLTREPPLTMKLHYSILSARMEQSERTEKNSERRIHANIWLGFMSSHKMKRRPTLFYSALLATSGPSAPNTSSWPTLARLLFSDSW